MSDDNECPNCGERLELNTDDRGNRAYGTTVVMTEGIHPPEVNMIAHCRHCKQKLKVWARVTSVDTL